jgi:hypothetical protein
MTEKITLEQIQELMQMLTGGDLPDGVRMSHQPQLTPTQAFGVIWYLQEHLHVLPGNFEQCDYCRDVFDADYNGHYIDPGDNPDDYGGWHTSIGVTQEMIAAAGGVHVCSQQCDVRLWCEKHPGWSPR